MEEKGWKLRFEEQRVSCGREGREVSRDIEKERRGEIEEGRRGNEGMNNKS